MPPFTATQIRNHALPFWTGAQADDRRLTEAGIDDSWLDLRQRALTSIEPFVRTGDPAELSQAALTTCADTLRSYHTRLRHVLRADADPDAKYARPEYQGFDDLRWTMSSIISLQFPYGSTLQDVSRLSRELNRETTLLDDGGLRNISMEALTEHPIDEALEIALLGCGPRADTRVGWNRLLRGLKPKPTSESTDTVPERTQIQAFQNAIDYTARILGVEPQQMRTTAANRLGVPFRYELLADSRSARTILETLQDALRDDRKFPGSFARRIDTFGPGYPPHQSRGSRLRHAAASTRRFLVVVNQDWLDKVEPRVQKDTAKATSVALAVLPATSDERRSFRRPEQRTFRDPDVVTYFVYIDDLATFETRLKEAAETATSSTGLPLTIIELVVHGDPNGIYFGENARFLPSTSWRLRESVDGTFEQLGEILARAAKRVPTQDLSIILGSCSQPQKSVDELAEGYGGPIKAKPGMMVGPSRRRAGIDGIWCSPTEDGPFRWRPLEITTPNTPTIEHLPLRWTQPTGGDYTASL